MTALAAALVSAGVLGAGVVLAGPVRAATATADALDRSMGGDAPAYHALEEGRVGDATTLLRGTLAADQGDGLAHQLLCRVFYAEEEADEAIRECELAVSNAKSNSEQAKNNNEQASDDELWLGRAYGMKARHAGPIAGFTLARKVQASFARAVELNPGSVAALNDLGEYDVAAPFVVGGGTDKARELAARMMPRFPEAAHHLLARIAASDGDLATAESEYRQEIAVQRSAEAWIDLAHFYQKYSRPDDALATIKIAIAADRSHGPAEVDAASILTAAHRDPALAERCLRDYLASRAKTDAAPAFKVHLQLGRLLAARGDSNGASREAEAAAELAPGFTQRGRPAQGL